MIMLHDYSVTALINAIVFVCAFAVYWRKTGVTFRDFVIEYGLNFVRGFMISQLQQWIVYPAALATREWMITSMFVTNRQLNSVCDSIKTFLLPFVVVFILYILFSRPRCVLPMIMGFGSGTIMTNED